MKTKIQIKLAKQTLKSAYERAVWFIALNDEPEGRNAADVAAYTSVVCISEVFRVGALEVAFDVLKIRAEQDLRGNG